MTSPVNQFVNLNDQQLYQMAQYQTAMDSKKSNPNSNAVLLSVPVVDSFARAAFTPGGSGAKSATFAKSMLGWCGVFALIGIYNSAFNALKNNVPAVKRFDQKHPVVSSALNLVGFWFALDYGFKGYKKLTDMAIKKFPEKYEMLVKQKDNLVKKIDSSWVDKKLYQPLCKGFMKLEENCPKVAKGIKYALPLAAPVIALVATAKAISYMSDRADKTERNYQELKYVQDTMREQIYS